MFKKISLLLRIIKNYENGIGIIYNVFLKKRGFMIARMRSGKLFLIRCNSRDFHTINEVFLDDIYGNFIRSVKYEGGIILDIGQNIGTFSIRASSMFKDANIIGFEPFPSSYQLAQTNIVMNNLGSRVRAEKFAISAKRGNVDFFVYDGNYEGNSMNDIWGWKSRKIEVESITLPDFIKKEKIKNIHLLKIDCEGAEYEILESLSKEDYKKISSIIIEYHKGRSKMIEDILKDNNFKFIKKESGKETGMFFAKKTTD